jgi:hypothetical protein
MRAMHSACEEYHEQLTHWRRETAAEESVSSAGTMATGERSVEARTGAIRERATDERTIGVRANEATAIDDHANSISMLHSSQLASERFV